MQGLLVLFFNFTTSFAATSSCLYNRFTETRTGVMSATITESGGNVFADLGFEPTEAAILEMRARLMSDLRVHSIEWDDSDPSCEETEDQSSETL